MSIGRAAAEKLLKKYDEAKPLYQSLCEKTTKLLFDVFESHHIQIHSINSRLKSRESISAKVIGTDKYRCISDVTDIAGIRIITYFSDQVDEIAAIIEKEFHIDPEKSVDKRALLDPDRFGYLSLHYICTFSDSRCALIEYSRLIGMPIEIQVRSILQHTWAEMEHDLGYKSAKAVPKSIRRRFSRLAGLLEMADDEFCAIRDALKAYEKELPNKIIESPADVNIDQASYVAFVTSNSIVTELDELISIHGAGEELVDPIGVTAQMAELAFLGIQTIAECQEALTSRADILRKFIPVFLESISDEVNEGNFERGVTFFYLGYVLSAEGGLDAILELAKKRESKRPQELAAIVMKAYRDAETSPV